MNTRSQNNVEHVFTVDDLGHLHRGGRLRWTSAVMGTVLKVKPILHVVDGQMLLLQRSGENRRPETHRRAGAGTVPRKWSSSWASPADDWEAAEKLQEMLRTTLGYKNFLVNMVGSVLGCHIGLEA